MSDDNPFSGAGFSGGDSDSGGSGSDTYTEVTSTSWLGRIFGSLIAAVIGVVLVLGSAFLLYWNEGRAVAAVTSLNAGARSVVEAPERPLSPALEGKLVHVSGPATAERSPADPVFHVSEAGALRFRRRVQLFQWKESEHSTTEKRVGGGETTTKTYTYTKEWSDTAIDSSKFKQPGGHANPGMTLRSVTADAGAVHLGVFRLDAALVDKLSAWKAVDPGPGAVAPPSFRREGDGFYAGAGLGQPAIGDMQVSFEAVEAQPISVVAQQVGAALTPFHDAGNRVIALVDAGSHTADAMFKEAVATEGILTWIGRGAGFVLMLIGFCLMAAPLSWLASVLPFLEGLVDGAAFLVALVISIPLTMAIIAVAWVVHRPVIGIGLLVAGLVVGAAVRWAAPRRRRLQMA